MKNKIISAVISTVMAVSAILPLSPSGLAANAAVRGDLNGDSVISADDCLILQNWITGKSSKNINSQSADMNGDGRINSFDLALMRKAAISAAASETDYFLLKINEVCTSNKKCFIDENGSSPDWVEIYNAGNKAVNLSGIGLSDGKKNRYKFTFPENTVIGAGGYVLVLCDDTDVITNTEYHAPFKLSASGETVYLTAPAVDSETFGEEIDTYDVPLLETDQTYGRLSDGSEESGYLTPTPLSSNADAEVIYVVEQPVFSTAGGFYDEGFRLSLSDKKNNKILYTLDGSDPRTSGTAETYSSEIIIYNNTLDRNKVSAETNITLNEYRAPNYKVDKGIIVRAVSVDSDGNFSDVATNGYYIGKTADYYDNMKVISVSTDADNLFDPETGIYSVGNYYYEWVKEHGPTEYTGDMTNPTNYNNKGREWERPCNFQLYEHGKLKYSADLGVRISGNWSRAHAQKSLKFYARKEYGTSSIKYKFFDNLVDANGNTIDEFDKIILHNGGSDFEVLHARDELNHNVLKGTDLSLQDSEPCVVFIDGEFWGFYFIREKLEPGYFKSHYGIKDVTYIKDSETEGSNILAVEYKNTMSELLSLDMKDDKNYQRVCDFIDIDNFAEYMAAETFLCNSDWCQPTYVNNYTIWRCGKDEIDENNPYADGKWRFAINDTDQTAGLWGGERAADFDKIGSMTSRVTWDAFSQLFYNLLENRNFQTKFKAKHSELIKNCFNTQNVNSIVDAYVSECGSAIEASKKRFTRLAGWFDIDAYKDFFRDRPYYANKYVNNLISNISKYVDHTYVSTYNWYLWADNRANAKYEYDSYSKSDVTVNVTEGGGLDTDVYMIKTGIILEKGKKYKLDFDYFCSFPLKLEVGVDKDGAPYTLYYEDDIVNYNSNNPHYSAEFVSSTDEAGRIVVSFYYDASKVSYPYKVGIKNLDFHEIKEPDVSVTTAATTTTTTTTTTVPKNELIKDITNWTVTPIDDKIINMSIDGKTVIADVKNTDGIVQLRYRGLSLEEGKKYVLSYTVSCSEEGSYREIVQRSGGDYETYYSDSVNIQSKTVSRNAVVIPDASSDSIKIAFNFENSGIYRFTDLSFVCVS